MISHYSGENKNNTTTNSLTQPSVWSNHFLLLRSSSTKCLLPQGLCICSSLCLKVSFQLFPYATLLFNHSKSDLQIHTQRTSISLLYSYQNGHFSVYLCFKSFTLKYEVKLILSYLLSVEFIYFC